MKVKKLLILLMMTLSLMSFVGLKPSKNLVLKMGTYSTCNCAKEGEEKFGLKFYEDYSFHYFDYSNGTKKIDIKGIWSINNNKIILKDFPKGSDIDNKWIIDKNGNCLKSRKGLSFTRLCNTKECK